MLDRLRDCKMGFFNISLRKSGNGFVEREGFVI